MNQKRSQPTPLAVCGVAAAAVSALWLLNALRKRVCQGRGSQKVQPHLQFTVITGEPSGAVFRFEAGQLVTVGRKDTNVVCLQDTGVSGQHFQASYNPDDEVWQLVDVGSTNGTTLNRFQIVATNGSSEPHTLCAGDRIHLGENCILLVACNPSGSYPTSSQTVGDLTALEIMKRLRTTPLPAAISSTVARTAYPALRTTSCCIQKQAAKSRNKTTCEDKFSQFSPMPSTPLAVFCVADGHCGDRTASDIQRLLPDILSGNLQRAGVSPTEWSAATSLHGALVDTFSAIDKSVEGQDGSTMSLLLLRGDTNGTVHIQAANVGDSAVVCADFARMVKYHLTDNHRVTQPAELQRLKDTNGLLTHNETRIMGLNLSRSIGDRSLKDLNSGFVAEPYISKVHSVAADEALLIVLASDGLWDVTSANLVMRVAYRVLADHPGDLELLCAVLMEHAISRRSKDDITIIVLQVDPRERSGAAS